MMELWNADELIHLGQRWTSQKVLIVLIQHWDFTQKLHYVNVVIGESTCFRPFRTCRRGTKCGFVLNRDLDRASILCSDRTISLISFSFSRPNEGFPNEMVIWSNLKELDMVEPCDIISHKCFIYVIDVKEGTTIVNLREPNAQPIFHSALSRGRMKR